MVDLAREAFNRNSFHLAADIYERIIRENGPTSEMFLGLADSLARGGQFAKAFQSYTNAYRFGKVTPEKLKHLVIALIDAVKQDIANYSDNLNTMKSCIFTCGLCSSVWNDPVTLPCGHTFCRKCVIKNKSKTCKVCNIVHHKLKINNLHSNVVLTNLVEKWFPQKCAVAQLKKKGNEYFSAKNYLKAVEVYSQAIYIGGGARADHILLSNRCHSYILMDQFEDALTDAEQVVLLRPDWPKGYFHKGCALYGLGQYEDAAVSFLQCLALDQMSSAKEYLSKALDKIFLALLSDYPKAYTKQQQSNSTLQQLFENNFSQQPLLPPNIIHPLSHVACSVTGAANTNRSFSEEVTPQVLVTTSYQGPKSDQSEQLCGRRADMQKDNVQVLFADKLERPISVDTAITMVSPTVSVAKTHQTAVICDSAERDECMRPEQLGIEDLECGLCYRLFYEPVTTPCGHTFCRKCLDRCLDHTITCPMCKGNLAEYLAERRQAVTDALQCTITAFFKEAYADRCKINEEEMAELTRMDNSEESHIPVFVCILAFPTIPCPLHVFEPRYRLMVRRCMESGTRQFGMCMNVGDNDDDFSNYGCMLEIRDVQYFPDGRSVVDTIGGRRFKVLSRGKRDGYNTAKVEFISDKPVDTDELQDVNYLQVEIHAMVKYWLDRLPTVHRVRITQHFGEIPDLDLNLLISPNGPKWAWWAVAVLPMDPRVQMAMLAMSSYKERLIALKKVLLYMNRKGVR